MANMNKNTQLTYSKRVAIYVHVLKDQKIR